MHWPGVVGKSCLSILLQLSVLWMRELQLLSPLMFFLWKLKPTYFCFYYYFLIKCIFLNNFLGRNGILQKFDYFSQWCELILKSIKCKRSQSRVIKMSVVVAEFMALVLILGVFWKYRVSYLVHTVALIQPRERLSEKWVGSPRIHLFHPPPAPNTHIHSHTHTLMLIWFEKISGNIIINFASY